MAMTQSQAVADELTRRTGRAVELVGVTTYGDVTRTHLAQLGGTGVFVNALRDRLLTGEIDFAVHSLKDLPTKPADGVAMAALPARDDPRDALIARDGAKLADLPAGGTVGTGSPRRVAQLRRLRPDLAYVPIRGNADTRLGKVHAGELDAVVLAYAGLARIGRLDEVTEAFDTDALLPAPGQGSLAVECVSGCPGLIDLLAVIDDASTRAAVTAERAVLATLEAGCSAPVGAYAVVHDGAVHLRAVAVSTDGGTAVRMARSGPPTQAEQLGRALASEMLAQGAAELIGEPAR
ncbi:MAG: hydroxymethylbilane synthase [Streptosporangiales bacterium]|nr:hydroxymethylbilane synthase [Streptosporangiales bacterium]